MHWKGRAILVHCLLKMSRFLWLRKKANIQICWPALGDTYFLSKSNKYLIEPDCVFMQTLIEIKLTHVTSHTFLCFLCATVTSSEVRFCCPEENLSTFSGSRIRPVGSQEHKDKAFSKASTNGWLKSPLQLHNVHVYSLQLSTGERKKKKSQALNHEKKASFLFWVLRSPSLVNWLQFLYRDLSGINH